MAQRQSVWILTDSNSGITKAQGEKLGIGVLPMPFFMDGKEYYENVTMDRDSFFSAMAEGKKITTSQPSAQALLNAFDEGLKSHDSIVYIPMSGGLSGSVRTAQVFAKDYDGKIEVVDNHRISCTQKQSVLEALSLANSGKSAKEIREILERHSMDASIYIAVETLEYLKKGGRITPAGAAIATVLNLKPILQIKGDKLDAYAKARGVAAAKEKLLEAVEKDKATCFKGKRVSIKGAYCGTKEDAALWKSEIEARFPGATVSVDPLALSIACHIGPKAVAIVCMQELEEAPHILYEI